jgi:hypothetical protein
MGFATAGKLEKKSIFVHIVKRLITIIQQLAIAVINVLLIAFTIFKLLILKKKVFLDISVKECIIALLNQQRSRNVQNQ